MKRDKKSTIDHVVMRILSCINFVVTSVGVYTVFFYLSHLNTFPPWYLSLAGLEMGHGEEALAPDGNLLVYNNL